MISDIRTIEYLLREWGRWAYVNRGLSLYYPSVEPYERMRRSGGTGTSLSDGEGEAVDAVVSVMRCRHRAAHDAVALHYVAGMPYRRIAEQMNCHHRTAADLVEQGRMYIEAALVFGQPKTA